MEIEIEIETHNRKLVFDVLGKNNNSVDLPGNAKLTYKGSDFYKVVGMPEIINFTLTFGENVVAGVVANWLYDKLKNKTEKITINRRVIELDKDKIKKIIEESIKVND